MGVVSTDGRVALFMLAAFLFEGCSSDMSGPTVKIPGLGGATFAYEGRPESMSPGPKQPNSVLLSNLGNRVTLPEPGAAIYQGAYRGPVGPIQRLISVGPEMLQSDAPGSWVINISAEYVWPNGIAVGGTYGAVTARVMFGSGGVQQFVDVDAWNSRVVIPGQRATVDVFWEAMGYVPNFGPVYTFPVVVTCSLERSFAGAGSMPPIKSYWVLEMADPADISVDIPIPPYATAYNYLPINPTAVGVSPLTVQGTTVGGQDLVLPAVIESMSRMNQFRALPPSAKVLHLEAGVYPFQSPGRVQFQINAGG